MAETPQDFTRAEDTVLSLSDKFAANANAKTVYGEPVHAGNRTIIPVARIGYLLGATSGGRNGETGGGGSGGVGNEEDHRRHRPGICDGLSVPWLPQDAEIRLHQPASGQGHMEQAPAES